jgi:spermidine synthase
MARFAELDWVQTPMGTISLRRRHDPGLDVDVYEVKLDDEYLMSSLFTVGEEALATLGLAAVTGDDLDVVVGGLGLGYTARAALADPRVARLTVVEALEPVIGWHRRGLLPHAAELTGDRRVTLLHADFFAQVAAGGGGPHDAILVDIDHSPRQVLSGAHAAFYTEQGQRRLAGLLRPGGVFGLWSDEAPDEDFLRVLRGVFEGVDAHVVRFRSPLHDGPAANTVYVARRG